MGGRKKRWSSMGCPNKKKRTATLNLTFQFASASFSNLPWHILCYIKFCVKKCGWAMHNFLEPLKPKNCIIGKCSVLWRSVLCYHTQNWFKYCVLIVYCVPNYNTFKLYLKDHIFMFVSFGLNMRFSILKVCCT